MAFGESLKREIRMKSAFTCCVCRGLSIDLEAHHIIPEAEGGPDTFDNAAPLCPNHHRAYGANPEKRKRLREMRDLLYQKVQEIPLDFTQRLEEVASRLEQIENGQLQSKAILESIK